MAQIPYDLISPILEHLKADKSSLRAVSICSGTLRHEAQRILFREVTNLRGAHFHLRFLRAVTASPNRLALRVRTYNFDPIVREWSLEEALRSGMEAMRNLTRLTVYVERSAARTHAWSLASMLSKCQFTLERFDCSTHPADVAKLVDTFLPRQRDLRHLGVKPIDLVIDYSRHEDRHRPRPINSNICPQLSSVAGSWDFIHDVLPTHQIMTLTAIYTCTASKTNICALAPALNNITTLSYHTILTDWEAVDRVPEFFPSVTILEMEITDIDCDEDIDVMCQLTALRRLILSRLTGLWHRPNDSRPIASKIFSKFSMNLQCIDYQIEWSTYARYTREQGDTGAPEIVSKGEVRNLYPNF